MPNIVNFTLWCPGYFCASVNTLELWSGMQLIYLETVWSFQGLLFKSSLGGNWEASSLGLIFPTTEANPLVSFTQCPKNYEVLFLQLEGKAWFASCVGSKDCSLCSFRWFFSHLRYFPHTCVLISPQLTVPGNPLKIPELSDLSCALSCKLAALASPSVSSAQGDSQAQPGSLLPAA